MTVHWLAHITKRMQDLPMNYAFIEVYSVIPGCLRPAASSSKYCLAAGKSEAVNRVELERAHSKST